MNKRTMRNSLARAMADVHKHQLTNFSTSREDRTNAGAMCMKCGMLAMIHYDAETGIFDGPVYSTDCPGSVMASEKKEPVIHVPFERLDMVPLQPATPVNMASNSSGSFYPAPVSPEFDPGSKLTAPPMPEAKAHRIPQPEKLQKNLKHLERDARKFRVHMDDPFKEDPLKILKKSGIVLKVMRKQLLEYAGVESREQLELMDCGLIDKFVDEEPEYWAWFWTAESQEFPTPEYKDPADE